jgi:hypothetical protein
MMGSDKIHTAASTYIHGELQDPHSHMYIHTFSVLMSSLPFTGYLKNTNEKFQKILFWCSSSHNFTPKINEEMVLDRKSQTGK